AHTYPDDIDILLVGPAGQKLLLMSDTGGAFGVTNVTLTFDDAAPTSLPDSAQIVSGLYKPTNFGANDAFAAPAPPSPYGETLSSFNGTNPNGTWSLYVVDDGRKDVGIIAGGWSLSVSTVPLPPTNNPPTISDIPNQATTTNTPTPLIPFLVGDVETAASNL